MCSPLPHRRPAGLLLAALATLVTACSSGHDSPEVEVPQPTDEAAAICTELYEQLPQRVAEQERGTLEEDTTYAAVWGDPAVTLRCGVPTPDLLTPESSTYDPMADAVVVNEVSWLLEEQPDGHRFTTTERTVFVELTVPDTYAPEVNALVDLAEPVDRVVPPDSL